MTRVDRAEFARLVSSFTRSAWRWECQGTYHEPEEEQPFRAWREGRPDYTFIAEWTVHIRRLVAEGRRFDRVRMVTDPPTEYLRWMFDVTDLNVEAGEDIRWIDEADARRLGGPEYDYYLLDDELVVILEFGDNGVSGAEVVDTAHQLAVARAWRDTAWEHATPHADYLSRST